MKDFRLSEANLSFKFLVSAFLIIVGIGYVFGLLNIYNNTGLSYTGLVTHYRGDVKTLSVPPEFAFSKLVHEHHVHLFSLAMLFFLVGIVFSLTQLPELPKAILVVTPFVGMLLDFTSFWLVVFVSPVFAWLAILFGACMATSFFLIIGRPLYEMWVLPIWHRLWGRKEIPWFLR